MKSKVLAIAAASIFLFASCNNSSSTSSDHQDTTASTPSSVQSDSSGAAHQSEGKDFMASMAGMMNKMKGMEMTGDFDVDFANMMIEHHAGALDMSQIELAQGTDSAMKAMAKEILSKQMEEQQRLKAFVAGYKPSGMKHGEGALHRIMASAESKMKTMKMSGDVDRDFATMMISHHEDGISAAKLEKANGMSSELKKMAQMMIDDQTKDIQTFKSWLSRNK